MQDVLGRLSDIFWGPVTIFLLVGTGVLITDIFNALMAWPNLVGFLMLSPVLIRATREYFSDPERVYPLRVRQREKN